MLQIAFLTLVSLAIKINCSVSQDQIWSLLALGFQYFSISVIFVVSTVFTSFLQLYDFKPEPYGSFDELKSDLAKVEDEDYKEDPPKEDRIAFAGGNVGVSCDGHNVLDKVHIKGVTFGPSDGISSVSSLFLYHFTVDCATSLTFLILLQKYFPYTNQKGYRSPFVVVKLDVEPRTLVQVTCKVWAKNIDNTDGQEKRGSVHFEIMVD